MQDAIKEEELNFYLQQGIINHYQETDDVKSFYRNSSVFVLPTSYREGTPRVILEAMAMGRPIITSDSPGCKETVIDGITGFLVPKEDIKALTEKMIWFIENQEQIPIMGNASYELCKSKFDVNIVNRQMLEIMDI
jgi:glycosyltransferase involved in cell wall biosynthesis